jgi:hypothetical protein
MWHCRKCICPPGTWVHKHQVLLASSKFSNILRIFRHVVTESSVNLQFSLHDVHKKTNWTHPFSAKHPKGLFSHSLLVYLTTTYIYKIISELSNLYTWFFILLIKTFKHRCACALWYIKWGLGLRITAVMPIIWKWRRINVLNKMLYK